MNGGKASRPPLPILTQAAPGPARDAALKACPRRRTAPPCAVVIFGASGDLAARKVFPAIHGLFASGSLPESLAVIGAARTDMDSAEFRGRVRKAVAGRPGFDPGTWDRLAAGIQYLRMDYAEPDGYAALTGLLDEADKKHGTSGNRLFYLAVPPIAYEEIGQNLGRAGLARQTSGTFARLVVEKPFGSDLASAMALDRALHQHFGEDQIFRIDHYLAKEAVRNILLFRFANAVFEPVWNRSHIASVTVAAAESLGVEHRAGYYERSGVLRDMFQNHMMQLLALCAMEPPSLFEAEQVRDEKVKLYRALKPFDPDRLRRDLVLGQYAGGHDSRGVALPAYRDEPGVDPKSITPTFAMLTAYVDNWRWQGVPFRLVSGKRLARKTTRIAIDFKRPPHAMFANLPGMVADETATNRLIMDIHPTESITLTFQAKNPGSQLCLRPVTMHFDFNAGAEAPPADSYATVLLDCMVGDHMLFWRQDGVELCWGFLTPILELCEHCTDAPGHLHHYPAGSWGPEQARETMRCMAEAGPASHYPATPDGEAS